MKDVHLADTSGVNSNFLYDKLVSFVPDPFVPSKCHCLSLVMYVLYMRTYVCTVQYIGMYVLHVRMYCGTMDSEASIMKPY